MAKKTTAIKSLSDFWGHLTPETQKKAAQYKENYAVLACLFVMEEAGAPLTGTDIISKLHEIGIRDWSDFRKLGPRNIGSAKTILGYGSSGGAVPGDRKVKNRLYTQAEKCLKENRDMSLEEIKDCFNPPKPVSKSKSDLEKENISLHARLEALEKRLASLG